MDCGLATQAWDKGDGTQNMGDVRMWPWSGSQATFILCICEGNNARPLFCAPFDLRVHRACCDDKGSYGDCPQGLESDSLVSPAATCGYVFTKRLLIRQWNVSFRQHFQYFRVRTRQTWIWFQVLLFSNCVTLNKLVDLPKPLFL